MKGIKGDINPPIKGRPPTLEEVKAYVAEKGYHFDPETFHAHYEANGWVQGNARKPIKNWKACCVTFEANVDKFKSNPGPSPRHDPYAAILKIKLPEPQPGMEGWSEPR
jgi:hypothetical protein